MFEDPITARMAMSLMVGVIGGLMTLFQVAIFNILKQIDKRIETYVEVNAAEHERLWKRLDCHRHDKVSGDVIIRHENV